MAKLRQKKNGEYIIKGPVPGVGSFATWQVSSQALDLLTRNGYRVDSTLPGSLVSELSNKGLISTGASGISRDSVHPQPQTQAQVSQERQTTVISHAMSLVFLESDSHWDLALKFAELPVESSQRADDLLQTLSSWKIIVDGVGALPATRLWPGRGGDVMIVPPRHEPYMLHIEGTVPEAWDVHSWFIAPPGMHADIVLFEGENGTYLTANQELSPGTDYYVIEYMRNPGRRSKYMPPPSSVLYESLGIRNNWQAWMIRLPMQRDDHIRDWCKRLGYQLAEARYRLNLVTPPAGYSEAGLPVVVVGQDIEFALIPVKDEHHTDLAFYSTCFNEPGSYRISVDELVASSLHLVARELEHVGTTTSPCQLTVQLTWGERMVTRYAFRDGSELCMFAPSPDAVEAQPKVEVWCSVPVTVRWQSNGEMWLRENLSTSELVDMLSDVLLEARYPETRIDLWLDAGAFGRLSFRFIGTSVSSQAVQRSFSTATLRRARWLATVLPGRAQCEKVIPLPRVTQRTVSQIAAYPGCEALAELSFVPESLLPCVRAITHGHESGA